MIQATNGSVPILHIATRLSGGGTSRLFYSLFKNMDRSRFELHVLCTHNLGDPKTIRQFEDIGVKIHLLPGATSDNPQDFTQPDYRSQDGVWNAIVRTLRVWRFLKRHQFPIVHIHNYSGNAIYAGSAAILARCPIVITHDLTSLVEHWKTIAMWRVVNRFYYQNITQSESGADRRAQSGGNPGKVSILTSGVDTDHFGVAGAQEREAARRTLGIGAEEFVVLAIGRLTDNKRFDRFIDAAVHFSDRGDVVFVLGGSGPLEESLKAQAERSGIGKNVVFAGWIEDPRDLYRAADVLVMCSDEREGYTLVVVEALAMGIPVISVDRPTQREMVIEEAGLLVDGDPVAIATAIGDLLGDRRKLEGLAAGARRTAERRYEISKAAEKLSGIYEKALSDKGIIYGSTVKRVEA